MKPTTLCFPFRVREDGRKEYVLGMKKRGFGAGKYNGFGGKVGDGESFRQCVKREMFEEVSLLAKEEDFQLVGLLDFQFPYSPELSHLGYIYLVGTFVGTPLESEEMKPAWYFPEEFPYGSMWAGDEEWIPPLLEGKLLKGVITFGPDDEGVQSIVIRQVDAVLETEDTDALYAWLADCYES